MKMVRLVRLMRVMERDSGDNDCNYYYDDDYDYGGGRREGKDKGGEGMGVVAIRMNRACFASFLAAQST